MSCPHSDDMEPEWCSQCLGKPNPEEPVRIARYDAKCPICQRDILVGQRIVTKHLRWIHEGCR